MTDLPAVLILTPLKDAAKFLPGYVDRVLGLTYPKDRLSLGWLEGDSRDRTLELAQDHLPRLQRELRRASLWSHDFGYQLPRGRHRSWQPAQVQRRMVLAKARNTLLFRALDDEEWVLWLDVDVIDYPADIIERLLATGADIAHPNCVLEYGGPSFDQNAWRDHGRLHLSDLRDEGDLVPIDTVGGTVLLVRADVHREGVVFPAAPYGVANPRVRPDYAGELETEGFGILASEMGYQCWGLPHLEVKHARH